MAISKRSEYALRAVFELAYRGSQEPVKIQRIAESQGIPSRFLEGIMGDLRHAGFVESRRGSEGGYVLVRDSGELFVGRFSIDLDNLGNSAVVPLHGDMLVALFECHCVGFSPFALLQNFERDCKLFFGNLTRLFEFDRGIE